MIFLSFSGKWIKTNKNYENDQKILKTKKKIENAKKCKTKISCLGSRATETHFYLESSKKKNASTSKP